MRQFRGMGRYYQTRDGAYDAIAGLPAKMLLQVHDELLFEVNEDAVDPLVRVVNL